MARVEKEVGKSIKFLRYDKGGALIPNDFNILWNNRGIVERRNRSIMDYARILMMEKNVLQEILQRTCKYNYLFSK